MQLHYLPQQHFLMQSFHVNETDLEMFRFCLNYLLWSHYFLGKIQMLFQVRFSAGEKRGRKETSSCSPVYSFTTSPMPQTAADRPSPAASWQMHPESWTATAAAQQNSWAREQRVLPLAGPTTGTCQGGSTLPNDRLCPKLCRKHLGKLDRHHLAKRWEQQQFGVTHGSAKQGSNWNKAAGGTATRGCCSYTIGCSDCFSHSFICPFLLHRT